MAFVYWIHLPEHTDILTEGYIGYTSRSVEERWKGHVKESSRARNLNYPVYNAMRKYGEAIKVTTIVEGSEEYCLELEFKMRPERKIGWNLQMGGNKGTKGADVTLETREKLSKAGKGRKMSEDHKEALRLANIGRKHTQESRERMSAERRGVARPCGSVSKQKQTLAEAPWIFSRKDKSVWATADLLYRCFTKFPEISAKQIASLFCTTESKTTTVLEKMRGGWVPENSEAWNTWKMSNPPVLENHLWHEDFEFTEPPPWQNKTARHEIWLLAQQVAVLISEKKTLTEMHVLMGFSRDSRELIGVRDKIVAGWSPSEDADYVSWREEYSKCHSLPTEVALCPPPTKGFGTAANRHIWLDADRIWNIAVENNVVGTRALSYLTGHKESSLAQVHRKIKAGWIPSQDDDWLGFFEQHRKGNSHVS